MRKAAAKRGTAILKSECAQYQLLILHFNFPMCMHKITIINIIRKDNIKHAEI